MATKKVRKKKITGTQKWANFLKKLGESVFFAILLACAVCTVVTLVYINNNLADLSNKQSVSLQMQQIQTESLKKLADEGCSVHFYIPKEDPYEESM